MKLGMGMGLDDLIKWVGAGGEALSTLLDGLVSYWPLNEQSGTRYDAVGSNDLTDNNTVGAVNRGPMGTVANFVAANSEKLSIASPGLVPASGPFTFAGWQYFDPSAVSTFVGHGSDDFFARYDATGFHVQAWDTGANYSAIAQEYYLAAGARWFFVWFGFDPVSQKVFGGINGVAATPTADIYGIGFAAQSTDIGYNVQDATYLNGRMGALGLWNVRLGTPEITSLFASGNGKRYADLTTAEKVGLVSYWNLDEVSGQRNDSHGTNHLTDNNTVGSVINAGGAMNGAAASFVAANSESLSSAAVDMGPWTSGFTMATWFKGSVFNVSKDDTNTKREFAVTGNDLYLFGSGGYAALSVAAMTDSQWHLLVFWYDPSDGKLRTQTDGAAVVVGTTVGTMNNSDYPVMLGRHSAVFSSGQFDEVAIWSRVLTADERAELYNAGQGRFYPFTS
jgi:hypothetical protein